MIIGPPPKFHGTRDILVSPATTPLAVSTFFAHLSTPINDSISPTLLGDVLAPFRI
jgi:hypothetical protein